jgi:hypothetical protein
LDYDRAHEFWLCYPEQRTRASTRTLSASAILMWILIGVLSGVGTVLWLLRPLRQKEDLGTVSAEWLAEYRQDTER